MALAIYWLVVLAFVLFILYTVTDLVSVGTAHVVGRFSPRMQPACKRHIEGWKGRLRWGFRIVLIPLILTVVVATVRLTDNTRFRSDIQDSNRLVIRYNLAPKGEGPLLDTEDAAAIEELADRIAFDFSLFPRSCACMGDMTFEFHEDEMVNLSFTYHHQKTIRFKPSILGDRPLSASSIEDLEDCLDKAGVTEKVEFIEAEQQRKMDEMRSEEAGAVRP
jgi:hypothetical protein